MVRAGGEEAGVAFGCWAFRSTKANASVNNKRATRSFFIDGSVKRVGTRGPREIEPNPWTLVPNERTSQSSGFVSKNNSPAENAGLLCWKLETGNCP